MIGISKHILLDSNDIFREFKNSITEQLQNWFVDWWRRKSYSNRSQGSRKFQSQSLKMYREKYDPVVCVRTSMANYRNKNNRLVHLPLYCNNKLDLTWYKKFLKISKMAGRKNLTSAGGRKHRFCTPSRCTNRLGGEMFPLPFLFSKSLHSQKNIKFKF